MTAHCINSVKLSSVLACLSSVCPECINQIYSMAGVGWSSLSQSQYVKFQPYLKVIALTIKCQVVGVTNRMASCCGSVDAFTIHTTFLYSTFHIFTGILGRWRRWGNCRKYGHISTHLQYIHIAPWWIHYIVS